MSTGSSAGTATASEPLRWGVSTGADNPVTVAPYQVLDVRVPRRWDPSSETLTVMWDIQDPNRRIRNGRIRYVFDVEGRQYTLHRQALAPPQLLHARYHELPPPQRWDGTITEGLTGRDGTENRIGQKVTADLSHITVFVEAWNSPRSQPGRPLSGWRGRTEYPYEWLECDSANAEIDAIAEARWDREWVIPYGDMDEPDRGIAGMRIRVRNVREGTPVSVHVYRIVDVARPAVDDFYAGTVDGPEEQPGLQNCVVRGDRVVHEPTGVPEPAQSPGSVAPPPPPPPGDLPFVRFNNYDAHWRLPGINFYAYSLQFGEHAASMTASERDYVNREAECLNMRFTVFIHSATGGTGVPEEAGALHKFFRRETRYYRSYLKSARANGLRELFYPYGHRYITVFLGHAGCSCVHADHPTVPNHSNQKMGLYHCDFPPDRYCCPEDINQTPAAQRRLEASIRHYGPIGPGCGNSDYVYHELVMPRLSRNAPAGMAGKEVTWVNSPGAFWQSNGRRFTRAVVEDDEMVHWLRMGAPAPRLLFWAGGCRTILSTELGVHFTSNGTRYYHGWVYSVGGDEDRRLALTLFRRWIKGTRDDPAISECDLDRFLTVYRELSLCSWVTAHARLLTLAIVLNARPDVTSTEGDMR